MRRISLGSPVGPAFDPRSHAFDFVLDQILPVFAVDIALLAVEMSGVVKLVSLHLLLGIEGLKAAFDVAVNGPDRLEWNHHLGGLEVGELEADGLNGEWRVSGCRVVVPMLIDGKGMMVLVSGARHC
jgi:hypothetical protein